MAKVVPIDTGPPPLTSRSAGDTSSTVSSHSSQSSPSPPDPMLPGHAPLISPHAHVLQRRKTFNRQQTVRHAQSKRMITKNRPQEVHSSAIYGAQEIHERALFCLWPNHPIRKLCLEIASHPYYTNFNLITILLNCVTLMIESGRDLGTNYSFQDLSSALNVFDAIFASCFTLEFIIKAIAGGFLFAGPSSYLRSAWNRLDFLVVIFALISFAPGVENFTYLRSLRLIRPLKAASSIPKLRVMMNAMAAATLTLGNVFLFVFLLLYTFGLLGLQIFDNSFRNRCYPLATGQIDWYTSYGFVGCADTNAWPIAWLGPTLCDTTSTFCADSGTNPYADTMGYDNIAKSWVMSLITMSGEGWSDIMYMAEDSVTALAWIYFVLLECLSNYLAGELVVAVMTVKFEDAKLTEQEKMREEQEQKQAVREAQKRIRQYKKTKKKEEREKLKKMSLTVEAAAAAAAGDGMTVSQKSSPNHQAAADGTAGPLGLDDGHEPTWKEGGHLAHLMGDLETAQIMKLAAKIKDQNREAKAKAEAEKAALTSMDTSRRRMNHNNNNTMTPGEGGLLTPRFIPGGRASTRTSLMHPFSIEDHSAHSSQIGNHRLLTLQSGNSPQHAKAETTTAAAAKLDKLRKTQTTYNESRRMSVMQIAGRSGAGTGGSSTPKATVGLAEPASPEAGDRELLSARSAQRLSVHSSLPSSTTSTTTWTTSTALSKLSSTFHIHRSRWQMHGECYVDPPAAPAHMGRFALEWHKFRLICHRLVFSPVSFYLFSSLTIANCVVLAADHWGISNAWIDVFTQLNIMFFVCFTIEFLLRFIAIQFHYFQYGYFICDLIIVILAGLDTAFTGSIPALSALKAFRVFRMFTVFRHWKAMQRIMKQAHSSLQDLFYFSLVLALFVFVFAQMGVQIAKGRENFPAPEDPARDNWDNIGWAMIVVFQVSTPENWNQVLYDLVQGVGWGGGVFIIVTLLIGHYVIESLFVVVMFSHFGTDEDDDSAAIEDGEAGTPYSANNRVVPIDHVQAMLHRAGVLNRGGVAATGSSGSREQSSFGPSRRTDTVQQQTDVQRLLSFQGNNDSPIISRQQTTAPQTLGLRTPIQRRKSGLAANGQHQHDSRHSSIFLLPQITRPNSDDSPVSKTSAYKRNKHTLSVDITLASPHGPTGASHSAANSPNGSSDANVSGALNRKKGSKSPSGRNPLLVGSMSHPASPTAAIESPSERRVNPILTEQPFTPPAVETNKSQQAFPSILPLTTVKKPTVLLPPLRPAAPAISKTNRASTALPLDTTPAALTGGVTISHPTGFLAGASPITVAPTGFLGRLARNIERSKQRKAQEAEEKELEQVRASISRSISRRASRRASKVVSQTIDQTPLLSQEASPSASRSNRRHLRQDHTSRRSSLSLLAHLDQQRFAFYMNGQPENVDKIAEESKENWANTPVTEMMRSRASSAMCPVGGSIASTDNEGREHNDSESQQKEKVTGSVPHTASVSAASTTDEGRDSATELPSYVLLAPHFQGVPDSTSTSRAPQLLTVAQLPDSSAPVLQHKKQLSVFTGNDDNKDEIIKVIPVPQTDILQTPLTAPLTATEVSVSVAPSIPASPTPIIAHEAPGTSGDVSSMPTTAPPPVPPSDLYAPPAYDAHIHPVRRRFVIPHHHPPGQPWYRVDIPSDLADNALYLFSHDNRFRVFLTKVIHSDAWSIGILVLIFCSCVLLALDYPGLDANSVEGQFLYYADLSTTCLYTVEMCCRLVVFGFVLDPNSGLRNKWNLMEFFIVVVSIASTLEPTVNALKALRALRPLRILSRLPGAKTVVASLGKSMLNISNVLVLSFLLLFTLAIVAVQLFQGKLQQCLLPPDGTPITVNEVDCAANGGIWTNPIWTGNYDNIGAALLVLFEICTEENWPGTMCTAVDATEPGLAPSVNNNQWVGIYFVAAIIVGSLFIKTLFTATILDGYSLHYAEITGAGAGVTSIQQQWIDFYKLAIDHPPPLSKPRPNTQWCCKYDLRIRRFFYRAVKSNSFEWFFLGVISLNVLALSMTYSYQSTVYGNMLSTINSLCTWLFVCELLILWLGSGVREYFHSKFNCVDCVIVILTVYEFFYEQNLVSFHIGFNPSIFRVIRMVRIFKLFQKFPRLVQLGQTVWFSLPALYNVGLLMILEYFIFSILGMALFGKVKHGYYMTNHGNYENFTSAMLTLFREMTGENWNGIMRDCMVQPPFCDESVGDCGNTILSPLFHVGFQVMSAMLVMDLIVAIILNQFENQLEKEKRQDSALLSELDIKIFNEHWSQFSHGKYTMPVPKLPGFLRFLPPPLGFHKQDFHLLYGVEMAHFLDELKIPCDNQSVHYLDVIHQLAYRAFLKKYPEVLLMEEKEEERLKEYRQLVIKNMEAAGGPLPGTEPDEMTMDWDEREGEKTSPVTADSTESIKQTRRSSVFQITASRSSSTLLLPYTTAGLRLANEDLQLLRHQAQRQFPSLKQSSQWAEVAGQVHRVVICQKLVRGVFDRRKLRAKLIAPLVAEIEESERQAEAAARREQYMTEEEAKDLTSSTHDTEDNNHTGSLNNNPAAEHTPSLPPPCIRTVSTPVAAPSSGISEANHSATSDCIRVDPPSASGNPATRHHRHHASPSRSFTNHGMLGSSAHSSGTVGYSVVAELMAMKALHRKHHASSSNLSIISSPSALKQPQEHSRLGVAGTQSRVSGGVSPRSYLPTPRSNVTTIVPPLLKASSVPLESTREDLREYKLGSSSTSGVEEADEEEEEEEKKQLNSQADTPPQQPQQASASPPLFSQTQPLHAIPLHHHPRHLHIHTVATPATNTLSSPLMSTQSNSNSDNSPST